MRNSVIHNKTEKIQPFLHWKWVLFIWIIIALTSSTTLYYNLQHIGRPTPWLEIFPIRLAVWLFWGAWAILVFRLAKKVRFDRGKMLYALLIHIPFSILSILINVAVYAILAYTFGLDAFAETPFKIIYKTLLLGLFDWYFLVYWGIVLVTYAFDYFQKNQQKKLREIQLESQLVQAQLQALKMQLQPHFLFNSLNTIASLIRQKESDTAVSMLSDLSDLLRLTLIQKDKQVVSLEQELNFIQRYLALERQRFPDKIDLTIDVDPKLMGASVPNFLLQPIIENAIKHGLAKKLNARKLQIQGRKIGTMLQLKIFNEGNILADSFNLELQTGIGLSSTLDRLQQLFAQQFYFGMENKNNGVEVIVRFPFQLVK